MNVAANLVHSAGAHADLVGELVGAASGAAWPSW